MRFDFLWKSDADRGQEEGKERYCLIAAREEPDQNGIRLVYLLPITHSPPPAGQKAVEIPHSMARHLGLDDDRSWIKTHERNSVEWPARGLPFGVIPASSDKMEIGTMHKSLTIAAREQVHERARTRSMVTVERDEC